MRVPVVALALLLVAVAIGALLYIGGDNETSVPDDSTVDAPARSSTDAASSDKPLTDEELDKLEQEKVLTPQERKELERLQNELKSAKRPDGPRRLLKTGIVPAPTSRVRPLRLILVRAHVHRCGAAAAVNYP